MKTLLSLLIQSTRIKRPSKINQQGPQMALLFVHFTNVQFVIQFYLFIFLSIPDVNECAIDNGRCGNQICRNTVGSFECLGKSLLFVEKATT